MSDSVGRNRSLLFLGRLSRPDYVAGKGISWDGIALVSQGARTGGPDFAAEVPTIVGRREEELANRLPAVSRVSAFKNREFPD
jgi:hypothetical protein